MFERRHHNNGGNGGDARSGGAATVLLVDDDSTVRKSLSRVVRSAGFTIQTFATGEEFLRHELPTGPACVLLDMQMEGMSGAEVHEALRRNNRHMPVIFLSGYATVPSAVAEVKNGATDFLEKPVPPWVLIAAITRALENDRAGSDERANQAELERRFNTLTPREQEVMGLVVCGLLNKQAAAELGISEKTIKVHRARVMEKMYVEALAPLVLMAERLGLTEPAEALTAY